MTTIIQGDRLAIAIAKSRSWAGVSRYLYLRRSPAIRAELVAAADRLGLDYSHFETSANAGRTSRRSALIIKD